MRKILKNKDLNERSASRTLLAVALAAALSASLSAGGCTTNLNRGNGEPATGSTNVTAPSATPGSSGGTVPQPMTSSSRLTNTPEEALAIMQQTLPTTRGRVLGPVNPPATGAAQGSSNEAMQFDGRNQRLTLNSSIANPLGPQSAIVNGAGGDSSDSGAIFTGTTVTGTTAPVTAAGSTGAVGATTASTPAITGATVATPTSAGLPITAGSLAAGTGSLTPTASSSVVPSATASTSAINVASSNASTNAVSTSNVNASRAATPTTGGVRLNRATVGTAGVSVKQTAAGKVVISNVK